VSIDDTTEDRGPGIELLELVGGAAAVRTAVDTGILDRLAERAGTPADVASHLGLDERITGKVLDVLAQIDVVIGSRDGHYRLARPATTWMHAFLIEWNRLTDSLRDGPPRSGFDQQQTAAQRYPEFVDVLADIMAVPARAAAQHLAAPGLQVLDVGAGAAPWSLALCRLHADINVTALDLPDVLAVTRHAAQAAGIADRFGYLPGSVFDLELPNRTYDLVLVGNLCHLFGPRDNQRLLASLAPALVPGGTLAILDGLADDAPTFRSACYRLSLALRTAEGDLHPLAAYREWLRAAGLGHVTAEPLDGAAAIHLIRGKRAGADTYERKRAMTAEMKPVQANPREVSHLVWEPPGPGMWMRSPSKQTKPQTAFLNTILPKGFNAAFGTAGTRYGLLIDGFKFADFDGWLYLRPKPVGAPDKAGPPPPRFVMRILLLVHPGLRARRKAAARALANRLWLQDGREWLDGGRDAFVARLRKATAEDPVQLSQAELCRHIAGLVGLLGEGLRIHFRDAICHSISIGDFSRHVAAWTGAAPHEAVNLLAGSSPFSLAPLDHLDRIVKILDAAPEARERFLDRELAAEDRLAALRSASPEAAATLEEYLMEYGHRSVSGFDLDAKSIAEMPEVLVASIAARVMHPVAAQTEPPDWLRPRVPDEHRAAYDALKAEAEVLYGLRENDVGPTFEWPLGLLRRALAVAGDRLAAEGALHRPDQILDASPEDVDALLRQAPDAPSAEVLAERQRRRLTAPVDPPLILGEREDPPSFEWLPGALGSINNALMLGMNFDFTDDATRSPTASAVELSGIPASRGVYRGPARVVTTPADFGRLAHGDVLVAPMTTSAYNVVLPLLGAVVTDTGGLLSHAAIVAREYRIPAVVATGTATTSITDGCVVTVDGDRGVVTIEG
jgi:pyruvate,water dikinase